MSEAEFLGKPVEVKGKEVECPPLLTKAEVDLLKAYPGNKALLLQTWAMAAAGGGYEKLGVNPALSAAMGGVGGLILKLRGCGGTITNTLALPIPFPYWHMMILIQFVSYFFIAFEFLSMNSYVSPIICFFTCLVLSGCTLAAPSNHCLAPPLG